MRYRRLLFVDDNIFSNMESCEYLRGNGFNVSGVYCATEAMELLASPEAWSALVTDIDLGPGLNGFDIARRARQAHPNLPIVFISGTAIAGDVPDEVIGAPFIPKPYHPRQIVLALNGALPRAVA